MAPGDPALHFIQLRGQFATEMSSLDLKKQHAGISRELGLDLPLFYFSIQPAAYPDTLHLISYPPSRKRLKAWLNESGSWPAVQQFERGRLVIESLLWTEEKTNPAARQAIARLKHIENTASFKEALALATGWKDSLEQSTYIPSRELIREIANWPDTLQDYAGASFSKLDGGIPVFRFHGTGNQYHRWISNVFNLDFGPSIVDARPAIQKIGEAFPWTFFYVLIAYLLSLMIGITLGLVSAWHHQKWREKWIGTISFIFYALPLFWLATLAVVFLTSDLYGPFWHWFPSAGIGRIYPEMSVWEKTATALPHLILPALILALHSSAGGIRIIRNSTLVELKADYFLTAKAKGLSNRRILMKHVFPNAMLPVITMLVSSFPSALAGSVIMEVVFNIPGIGRLLFDSIHFMDWNVVFALLLFMGLVTFVFYLIGDLLYAWLNPKIKLG